MHGIGKLTETTSDIRIDSIPNQHLLSTTSIPRLLGFSGVLAIGGACLVWVFWREEIRQAIGCGSARNDAGTAPCAQSGVSR
jgi:hypothetical protein